MEMKVIKSGKTFKDYSLVISEPEIREEMKKMAEKVAPKFKLPGYRQGNVPIDIIQKNKMQSFVTEAFAKLAQNAIVKEVKSNKFDLATEPKVLNEDLNFDSPHRFEVKIRFEFQPQLPKIDYSKIEAEVPSMQMTDEELGEELSSIANANSSVETIDDAGYKIGKGDVAVIDFEGFLDGDSFEGGKAADYYLEIGSNSFVDNFEDQLINHKKGDLVDIEVTFPSSYGSKNLAGKKVLFKVKVNRIAKKIVPEINDDLAKLIGLKDLEELRDRIKQDISNIIMSSFYLSIRKPLLEMMVSKHPFDLPESVLQGEIDARMKGNANDSSGSESDIISDVKRDLSFWYFIKDIIKSQDINISDDDFKKFIHRRAARDGLGDPMQIIQLCNQNPAMHRSIMNALEEESVIEYILSQISKKEIVLNKKDFLEYVKDISSSNGSKWKLRKKGLLG